MATHFANDLSGFNDQLLSFRPSKQVMSLERMGAYHQSRLSFMRCLIRRIFSQQWDITMSLCELDSQGYGTVIYTIKAPGGVYSFVVFSNYLADEQRNDRVIATQWDLTMALVEGTVSQDYLSMLKENVPKQEAGRVDSRVFVLSRANRSARNFNYVVKQLAQGKQPDINKITKVGYLYRTTACYGSGKLGMADWEKVKNKYTDFARPFAAEMFACFMIRNFSFFQAQYIAKQHSPDTFKPMDLNIKRYIGIGNSTGLGMAPFLVNHPLLINQWVEMRELALARIRQKGKIDLRIQQVFNRLLQRCVEHIKETHTEDDWQSNNNQTVLADLQKLKSQTIKPIHSWDTLIQFSEQHFSLQAQELLVSLLLELYPEHVDDLEDRLDVEETMHLNPAMPLTDLKAIIENKYQWALDIDFNHPDAKQTCWYRSEQKMEPRLGSSSDPEGKKKQMALGVGYAVRKCYEQLTRYHIEHNHHTTASFLIKFPKLRGIVRRIQTMNNCIYGDIQANLLDKHVLPIHLLRAKLAFFGVSKFDPRSRLWVRNTMFQGAPLLEDIGTPFNDDWFMPMAPK